MLYTRETSGVAKRRLLLFFNSVRRWLEESAVWTIAKRTSGEKYRFQITALGWEGWIPRKDKAVNEWAGLRKQNA
jgi:hypothetical protein